MPKGETRSRTIFCLKHKYSLEEMDDACDEADTCGDRAVAVGGGCEEPTLKRKSCPRMLDPPNGGYVAGAGTWDAAALNQPLAPSPSLVASMGRTLLHSVLVSSANEVSMPSAPLRSPCNGAPSPSSGALARLASTQGLHLAGSLRAGRADVRHSLGRPATAPAGSTMPAARALAITSRPRPQALRAVALGSCQAPEPSPWPSPLASPGALIGTPGGELRYCSAFVLGAALTPTRASPLSPYEMHR